MAVHTLYRVSHELFPPTLKSLHDEEKIPIFLKSMYFFVRISNIVFFARAHAQTMRNAHQLSYFTWEPQFLIADSDST